MKRVIYFLSSLFVPVIVFAQENHGHSHGSGGELEHSFPVLIILGLLVLIGGAFFLFNKKK